MGSKCCTSKHQTVPPTTTTISERPQKNTTINYESSSSDNNYEPFDTLESEAEEDGNETSVSITQDTKQRLIAGFKDAVEKGNDSLVTYYLREHSQLNLLDLRFPNGDTPLHVAVRNKAYRLIIYLLEQGISPNVQNDKTGDSPLHTAAQVRELNCVNILISKYDADINITNNKHETALTIAASNKDKDIIEALAPETQHLVKQHIRSTSDSWDSDDPDNIPALETISTQRVHEIGNDILMNKPKLNDNESSLKPPKNYQIYNKPRSRKPVLNDQKSFEEKMGQDQLRKLQEIKIARTNPFSKLKRKNTQKALVQMQNITAEAGKLPKLEAWLEKKKPKPPYSWQKRWVIVRESHFLWSDKQRTIKDPKSQKERAKFNGNLSLMMIQKVEAVTKKSKSQRKFKVTAKEGTKSKVRDYLFRAASREDRDYWVKSLNIHIDHRKELIQYLGTK